MSRVLRFMSANEAIKLLRGERVHNETNHRQTEQNSDSVGFCFATVSLLDPELIYEHAIYLSGVNCLQVCLMAEIKDRTRWKSGQAHFRGGPRTELAVTEYSLQDFVAWAMYTPQLPKLPEINLYVPVSTNWAEPILAAKRGTVV